MCENVPEELCTLMEEEEDIEYVHYLQHGEVMNTKVNQDTHCC